MFNGIFRILKIAEEDKKSLYLSILCSVIESMMTFVQYILVFYSIHLYINKNINNSDILFISIVMFLSIIFRIIFRRLIDGLQSAKGLSIFARQRIKLVNHLKNLPMGYFSEDNMGNIISVLTTDLIFAEEAAMTYFGQLISGYISVIVSILFMLIINVNIGVIYIVILLISYIAITYLNKINKKFGKIRQNQLGDLSNSVVEFIKGISIIKAFSMDNEKGNELNKAFRETRDKALEFEKKYFFPRLLTESSFAIGSGALIIATLLFYYYRYLTIDMAIGMLILSSVSLSSIIVIVTGITRFGILEAVLDRYDSIMEEKALIDKGVVNNIDKFNITFDNVSFSYENHDVIKNMSFEIKENTVTAIVGHSGSGKSTIANIMVRFWDIDRGKIKIGGKDIKSLSLNYWLSNISMVFQNVYLFEDSIFNNIVIGKNKAKKEEVIEAAKRARCHEFIIKLPKGYNTAVGLGGATLSGGEKQRISIARAILKNAPIVLLDEATSSVDPENELYIQEAINELVKDKTLIVIAHGFSSIREADNILVIEEGKLVEQGNHKELIKSKGVYNKMYTYYRSS